MNNQTISKDKNTEREIKSFERRLKIANKQLVMIGQETIDSPTEDFKDIPLENEYKVAFNAYKSGSPRLQEVLTTSFPTLISLLIAVSTFVYTVSSPKVTNSLPVVGIFLLIVFGYFSMYWFDSKTSGAQAIVDAILKHRVKHPKSTHQEASSQLSNEWISEIDASLKETILAALREHQSGQHQPLRKVWRKLFHRL